MSLAGKKGLTPHLADTDEWETTEWKSQGHKGVGLGFAKVGLNQYYHVDSSMCRL